MAEGEAEKRRISRLDFNVNDAINSLDIIDKKLKSIAETSGKFSTQISQNISKGITVNVNTDDLKKNLVNVENLTKASKERITVNTIKEAQKNENAQSQIVLKGEQARQTAAYKSMLKQEEYNQRVLKSTESLYDKITQYAKTYVIYQGFNMLKQGIQETIDEMVQVQYRMVEIDRVLNESSLDIDKYRDRLIQLAYDYGNSFDNVSDITLRLAKAGFDSQEAIALTEKTLLALNTAELNATQATDDMVAVMAQWGLTTGTAAEQAKAYGDIIDKVNKVGDNFPTTSEDILNALKKVSSAFNLSGATINETIATIVAAEKASQRGGKVIGTALSNIVQQLKAEGKINIMESLGIDVYKDSTKTEFNSIIDILGQLSSKMQELKNSGKESSSEMQNLLEVFTVFRRNVGAGLLSEMAGEDSTYAKVIKATIESVGYSAQENEKHMKTAKAAQAQFNAELLKLKTEVWDKGLEDVFRSMLLMGNDLAGGLQALIKTFGVVPTSIGAATLAFTAFNKKFQAFTFNSKENRMEFSGLMKKIVDGTKEIKRANAQFSVMEDGQIALTQAVNGTGKALVGTNKAAGQYITKLAAETAKTIGLEVATIALNAAISLGLSFAITGLLKLFDNLIHAQEKYLEGIDEEISKTQDKIDEIEKEKTEIDSLIKEYDELAKKESRTPEENAKIYEIQLKINQILDEQGKSVDLVNGKYEEQLETLKQISLEESKRLLKEKERRREEAYEKRVGVGENYFLDVGNTKQSQLKLAGVNMTQVSREVLGTYATSEFQDLTKIMQEMNWEQQLKYLTEWQEKLEAAKKEGKDVSEALKWVEESLETLSNQEKEVTQTTSDFYDILAQVRISEWFSEDRIKNVEDYEKALEIINSLDFSGMDGFKEKLIDVLQNTFPQFANMQQEITTGNNLFRTTISETITSLTNYGEKINTLTSAQEEFNSTGSLTTDTLLSIINSGYLEYVDVVNGKMDISRALKLLDANATKEQAIASLQVEAAERIQIIAGSKLTEEMKKQTNASGDVTEAQQKSANAVLQATEAYLAGKIALEEYNKVMKDNNYQGGNIAGLTQNQINQIQGVLGQLKTQTEFINRVTLTSAKASGGSGGSSSAAASAAKREAEAAAKAAQQAEEDAYKARLASFKNYVTEKERLEKRWVDNQKKLGLLSNDDFIYITQQRIERYKKYLDELNKATWMRTEDRLALEKTYTEKIEDLQVDYFGYLEDKLNDEIDAYKKANEEKIDLIKQEADERISALRTVESENDRIRRKEEYEKKRAEHLEDISYWEQRTGREAQEALKEARANLKELDEEWEQQLEDWSIDDQIKAIEDERDAQVKAIEDTQQAEIDSMKAIYDAKVQLFTESGQIIYENSVIQSQNLYNQYKTNFIDPIKADLQEINKVTTPTQPETPQQQYETYLIKSGDTLSKIARNYGTTVDKIMEANPYIKNRNLIYTGNTLQIPKFHEGGIVGGHKEAFALLKPDEVILKPEWADGINKLVSMVKNNENPITNNSTVIEVSGDLVKIDAKISNKTEAEYLTRQVEKMLKDKFNIKK